MESEQLIKELLKEIEDAVSKFTDAVPELQKDIYNKVTVLLKGLDTSGGDLKNSIGNLKPIGSMKKQLEDIVVSPKYEAVVKNYLAAFQVVKQLNDKYFSALSADFSPDKLLEQVRDTSVQLTAESLTAAGINANIIEPAMLMVQQSITSGMKYADMLENMRNFMLNSETGEGALLRYTRQITTDAINQFSRQYHSVIAVDLGMGWRMYVGSLLQTSRPFCVALEEKKYYHISELPDILDGHIGDVSVPINPKTGVWYGGIPGTNEANFDIYCGGYTCGHHAIAVAKAVIPKALREQFGD